MWYTEVYMKHWQAIDAGFPPRGDGRKDCFGSIVKAYVRTSGEGSSQWRQVGQVCATCGSFEAHREGLVEPSDAPPAEWANPEVKEADAAWRKVGGPL